MIANESLFSRIEQSFTLFISNFIGIFLPLFLYNFITTVVLYKSFQYVFFSWDYIWNNSQIWIIPNITTNTEIFIVLSIFLVIMYYIILIPFWIATIKSIKDWFNWEKININENIIYWFKNIFNSFKTYWYIFAYVALIPSVIFIVWGILLNIWVYEKLSNLTSTWIFLMILSIIIFIVFSVYRWIKSTFALYNAIDNDIFTNDNFKQSILLTDNNWWRIVWNFILLSIITSILLSIISVITSILTYSLETRIIKAPEKNTISYEKILKNWNVDKQYLLALFISDELWVSIENVYKHWNFDINYIINNISKLSYAKVTINDFIKSFINLFVASLWEIYLFVFIYIFYRRLHYEKSDIDEKKDIVL